MSRLPYRLLYYLAKLFSVLPLWFLYGVSDLCRILVYHVFRYRRKIVRTNLKNAFPEKSLREIKRIEWRFYRHFCDMFIEVIFMMHASKRRVARMVSFKNVELVNRYYQMGKSVVVTGGHYGNWELYSVFPHLINHTVLGVFKPIRDKEFEAMMNNMRCRFGTITVSMRNVAKMAMGWDSNAKPFFLGLINDQTPARSEIRYWTRFLNQDTAVFLGAEKLARKLDHPVLFCNMRKVKRGKYEVEVTLLVENPKQTKPYEITEMHLKALESLIREAPEYWLWSHKRWKYKPEKALDKNSCKP